ncbi:Guanine nucleotide exchange factor for Cdc42p [Sorochytrium milnesiophthora]
MPLPLKISTSGPSLYQQCVTMLRQTQRLPNFQRYIDAAASDPSLFSNSLPSHSTPEGPLNSVQDPVSLLWNTLRLGEPLSFLFNLTNPPQPIELASAKTGGDVLMALPKINDMKSQVYHFLVGCRTHLHMRDDELFSIMELYQDDTNGFVKVVRTTSVLLEKLELLGCLPSTPTSSLSTPSTPVQSTMGVATPIAASFTQTSLPMNMPRRSSLRQSVSAYDMGAMESAAANALEQPLPSASETHDHAGPHTLTATLPKPIHPPSFPGAPPSLENARSASTSVLPVFPPTSALSAAPSPMLGPSGAPVPQQALSNRDKVMLELLETERKYVADLEFLQTYMKYLIDHDVLPPDQIPLIFANLNALVDFQRKFLILLESILGGNGNFTGTGLGLDPTGADMEVSATDTTDVVAGRIGSLFEQIEKLFSVYETFCANYKTAADLVLDQAPALQKAAEIVEPTYELPSLLIKPIQRVCRYPLLLGELLKQTPPEQYCYEQLQRGLDAIKRVTDRVNETRRRQENDHVRDELERRIEDWKGHNITQFGELLLYDKFTMLIQDIERDLSIFLFDKIILCCKETAPNAIAGMNILKRANRQSKKKDADDKANYGYQIKGRIWIGSVTSVVGESNPGNWTLKVNWKSVEMDSFTLKCRNDEQLKLWQSSLQRCINRVEDKRRRINAQNASQAQPDWNGSTRVLATPSGTDSINGQSSMTGSITGRPQRMPSRSALKNLEPEFAMSPVPEGPSSTRSSFATTMRNSRDSAPADVYTPSPDPSVSSEFGANMPSPALSNLNDSNSRFTPVSVHNTGSSVRTSGQREVSMASNSGSLRSSMRSRNSQTREETSDDGGDRNSDTASFLDPNRDEEEDQYYAMQSALQQHQQQQQQGPVYKHPPPYDYPHNTGTDGPSRRVIRSKSAVDMGDLASLRNGKSQAANARSHQSYVASASEMNAYNNAADLQTMPGYRSHSSTPPPKRSLTPMSSAPGRPPMEAGKSISRGPSPQPGPPSPTFRRKPSMPTMPMGLANPNLPPPTTSLPPLPSAGVPSFPAPQQDMDSALPPLPAMSSSTPAPPPRLKGGVLPPPTATTPPMTDSAPMPSAFPSRHVPRSVSASPVPVDTIRIRVTCSNERYTFTVPKSMSYRSLTDRLYRKIRGTADDANLADESEFARMRLKYQDEDGDYIVIRTDEDVKMAFDGGFERNAAERQAAAAAAAQQPDSNVVNLFISFTHS